MDLGTLSTIITAILAILGTVLGSYKKYKNKVSNAIALLNEVKQAYQDDRVTNEEIKKIIDKYNDLLGKN